LVNINPDIDQVGVDSEVICHAVQLTDVIVMSVLPVAIFQIFFHCFNKCYLAFFTSFNITFGSAGMLKYLSA